MISRPTFFLICAAAIAAAQCFSAAAQPVTRVKARLTAFDGTVMTLEPLSTPPPAASGKAPVTPDATASPGPLTVSVTPATRYVGSAKAQLADIKPGDYAGASLSAPSGDRLRAQEVFLYAEALRGTGEGRFPEGDRLIINGTASAVKPGGPQDSRGGTLTLHYHGSVLTGLGLGKTLCEGRASPPAYASALACEADAVIEVASGTPVSSLSEGDKSLLVPGAMVTVAIAKAADGTSTTPGIVVEKPAPPAIEKPQTPP
ncbi:MAG TPA: hypothetical protein VHZ32_06790 [Rhizomicrobium sp.]|nr:hypothetical protein [Rhizomicrobium sp.]